MYDILTIGDIKLDAFIDLNNCDTHCGLNKDNLQFSFGEKITVDLLDQQVAGSALNVATALARLGRKTGIVSEMGDDTTHQMTLEHLQKEDIQSRYITKHKHKQSAYSAVLILNGEKTILASYTPFSYRLPKTLPKTKWMYMSEMGSGYKQLFRSVAKHVRKNKIRLGFNPGNQQIAERDPALYALIKETSVLFVNIEEGQRIAKTTSKSVHNLAKKLYALGPETVVITDGPNGSYAFDGTDLFFAPIYPGKRTESTGAGDSFASAFIGALMQGEPIQEGLRWGSVNAASVVQTVGPTPGLLAGQEIRNDLKKQPSYQSTRIN